MAENIKFIVQEVNKLLGTDFNLISFDSLSPEALLQILVDVCSNIGSIDKVFFFGIYFTPSVCNALPRYLPHILGIYFAPRYLLHPSVFISTPLPHLSVFTSQPRYFLISFGIYQTLLFTS